MMKRLADVVRAVFWLVALFGATVAAIGQTCDQPLTRDAYAYSTVSDLVSRLGEALRAVQGEAGEGFSFGPMSFNEFFLPGKVLVVPVYIDGTRKALTAVQATLEEMMRRAGDVLFVLLKDLRLVIKIEPSIFAGTDRSYGVIMIDRGTYGDARKWTTVIYDASASKLFDSVSVFTSLVSVTSGLRSEAVLHIPGVGLYVNFSGYDLKAPYSDWKCAQWGELLADAFRAVGTKVLLPLLPEGEKVMVYIGGTLAKPGYLFEFDRVTAGDVKQWTVWKDRR